MGYNRNQNPGLALPLIALQYHEVKFNLQFRQANQCYVTDDAAAPTSGTPSFSNASLWVNYVYLDTDERRRFAQVAHEYLIEQLQFAGDESISSSNNKVKLTFNHPVKYIAWVIQLDSNVASNVNRHADYTDGSPAYGGGDTLNTAQLKLNGHDRFATQTAKYFNVVQPYENFKRSPAVGIYVYSFAEHPLQHQPSGTVNMSRIDNAEMQIATTTGSNAAKVRFYAVNYNVLTQLDRKAVRTGKCGVSQSQICLSSTISFEISTAASVNVVSFNHVF